MSEEPNSRFRGRSPYVMGEEHRLKIANSNILNCLIGHTQGDREMSPSQVTAGLGLLRKVMPDLAIMEHQGEVRHFVISAPEPAADAAQWLQDRDRRMIDVTPQGATTGATAPEPEPKA